MIDDQFLLARLKELRNKRPAYDSSELIKDLNLTDPVQQKFAVLIKTALEIGFNEAIDEIIAMIEIIGKLDREGFRK